MDLDRHGEPLTPKGWLATRKPINGAYVCQECGSTRVQHLDWVDANRDGRLIGGNDGGDSSDLWCAWCDDHGHDGHQWFEWVDLARIRPNARERRKALKAAQNYGANAAKHKLPHEKP